jgi:hypothetical protein
VERVAQGAPVGPDASVAPDGTACVNGRVLAVRVGGAFEVVQRYLAGTPLLQTVWVTDAGATGVTDFDWNGELVRVVRPYTGAADVEVEGAGEDGGRRAAALARWLRAAPALDGADRELLRLSAALVELCGAAPGEWRDPAETDDLGLWRRPDGTVDLGAHAAFVAALRG